MYKEEYLNFSNFLSFIRIFFVIPIAYYIIEDNMEITFLFIGLAILTDWFDGFFARKLNQITTVGKVLDPLADKICTIGVFTILVLYRDFPLWIAAIIIGRDLIIMIGSLFIFGSRKLVTPSNVPGKITVVLIALLVIVYLLQFEKLFTPLTILVFLMILYSGISYASVFFKNVSSE